MNSIRGGKVVSLSMKTEQELVQPVKTKQPKPKLVPEIFPTINVEPEIDDGPSNPPMMFTFTTGRRLKDPDDR